jgi:hypothetical protein
LDRPGWGSVGANRVVENMIFVEDMTVQEGGMQERCWRWMSGMHVYAILSRHFPSLPFPPHPPCAAWKTARRSVLLLFAVRLPACNQRSSASHVRRNRERGEAIFLPFPCFPSRVEPSGKSLSHGPRLLAFGFFNPRAGGCPFSPRGCQHGPRSTPFACLAARVT